MLVVLERIRKLERKGIVRSYEARLNPEAVGLGMLAFLFVRAAGGPADSGTAEKLAEIPAVLEVHHIAGEDCFLLKVRTDSPRGLRKILTEDCHLLRQASVGGYAALQLLEPVSDQHDLMSWCRGGIGAVGGQAP